MKKYLVLVILKSKFIVLKNSIPIIVFYFTNSIWGWGGKVKVVRYYKVVLFSESLSDPNYHEDIKSGSTVTLTGSVGRDGKYIVVCAKINLVDFITSSMLPFCIVLISVSVK